MEHGGSRGTLAPECFFIRKRSLSLCDVPGPGQRWGVENQPDPASDCLQGRPSGERGRQAGGLGDVTPSPHPAEDPDPVLGPGLLLGVPCGTEPQAIHPGPGALATVWEDGCPLEERLCAKGGRLVWLQAWNEQLRTNSGFQEQLQGRNRERTSRVQDGRSPNRPASQPPSASPGRHPQPSDSRGLTQDSQVSSPALKAFETSRG